LTSHAARCAALLLWSIAVLRIMQAFSRVFFLKLYYFYPLIKSSTILECVLQSTRPLLLPCLSFRYCSVFKVHRAF